MFKNSRFARFCRWLKHLFVKSKTVITESTVEEIVAGSIEEQQYIEPVVEKIIRLKKDRISDHQCVEFYASCETGMLVSVNELDPDIIREMFKTDFEELSDEEFDKMHQQFIDSNNDKNWNKLCSL